MRFVLGILFGIFTLGAVAFGAAVLPKAISITNRYLFHFFSDFDQIVLGSGKPLMRVASNEPKGSASDFLWIKGGTQSASGPIAATESGQPIFIDAILQKDSKAPKNWSLTAGAAIEAVGDCRPVHPQEGTRVAHAYAGLSTKDDALYILSAAQFAARMNRYADGFKRNGDGVVGRPEKVQLVDLIVTDSSQPLHLVLSGSNTEILWVLHAAEGVDIRGVTLLNGRAQALAGFSDDIVAQSIDEAEFKSCGIDPTYPAFEGLNPMETRFNLDEEDEDDWDLPKPIDPRAEPTKDDKIAAYDRWFRRAFGIRAFETRTGYYEGTAVLIGPSEGVAPVMATSLSGINLRVPEGTRVYGRGYARYEDVLEAEINTEFENLVGVPLSTYYANAGASK